MGIERIVSDGITAQVGMNDRLPGEPRRRRLHDCRWPIGFGTSKELAGRNELTQESDIKAELVQLGRELEAQALQPECEIILDCALHSDTTVLNLKPETVQAYLEDRR